MKIIYTKADLKRHAEYGRQGGKKSAKVLLEKYGPDYFQKMNERRWHLKTKKTP